jgi:hypothetical protein
MDSSRIRASNSDHRPGIAPKTTSSTRLDFTIDGDAHSNDSEAREALCLDGHPTSAIRVGLEPANALVPKALTVPRDIASRRDGNHLGRQES